ncbi:DUF445 domain-containing protein [Paenibacillus sp. 1P07SE]|uniref:DUF445 domain-containing protein n=1 Tax=Paenibacillus sp. 1P07SE TaxID=3132209 RepID=UPI0039A68AC6
MNTRNIATLSLLVMGVGFAVMLFLPDNLAVELLKGGFEAGLVGGIADWFAVTALFHHPLQIPIPHTALLIKNRVRIIQSLISALENELLNKQSIQEKLRAFKLMEVLSGAVLRQLRRPAFRRAVLRSAQGALAELPLAKAVQPIQAAVGNYARQADIGGTAQHLLTRMMERGYDEKALDYVLQEAIEWARKPSTQEMLGRRVSEKLSEVQMGGLMGFAIQAFSGFMSEEKLGPLLQNMLLEELRKLREADNESRAALLRELRIRMLLLADNEKLIHQLQSTADEYLQSEAFAAFILARLEELRVALAARLAAEEASGGGILLRSYISLVRYLARRPELPKSWEDRVIGYVIDLVETHHYRIGILVRENLEKLDNKTLVAMIEQKVGKDLQWIRVNGALCGFVVGVVLTVLQLALGR